MDNNFLSAIGAYKTNKIFLGQSNNPNQDGVKELYIILVLQSEFSPLSQARRRIIFESQLPSGLFDTLKQYIDQQHKDARGGYEVDLKALLASADAETVQPFMRFPGMFTMVKPLSKGLCYQNDVNGNRQKNKAGQDIITDKVEVLCQAKAVLPGDVIIWELDPDKELHQKDNKSS